MNFFFSGAKGEGSLGFWELDLYQGDVGQLHLRTSCRPGVMECRYNLLEPLYSFCQR